MVRITSLLLAEFLEPRVWIRVGMGMGMGVGHVHVETMTSAPVADFGDRLYCRSTHRDIRVLERGRQRRQRSRVTKFSECRNGVSPHIGIRVIDHGDEGIDRSAVSQLAKR